MAHGEDDYTNVTLAKVVSAKVDFDLPVILIDRFDSANTLWTPNGLPIDYDAGLEAAAAYEGDAGLALRSSLAAAGDGEFAEVTRYAFTTPTRKLSFSALFRINQDRAAVRSLQFTLQGRYNQLMYRAAVRYRAVAGIWDYNNNTLGWTPFLAGIEQHLDAWNRIYFEIDLQNLQYIACETADRRVTLQGTPIWTNAVAGNEMLIANLYVENQTAGTRADVSIDDIIVKELG